jgi:hypothetical protein
MSASLGGRDVRNATVKRSRLLGGSAILLALALLILLAGAAHPAETLRGEDDEPWLHPYTGPTRADVDASALDGKVLCGYQGWFNTPGDGTDFGFGHWGQALDRPGGGRFQVDMWPDTSEYDPKDLCEVPGLKMPDGSPARLYSGFRKGPVLLHSRWMRQYGLDGVFLSRFVSETTSPARARHINTVLASVREGCHREGRVWAMMLDLSMGRRPSTATVINDWKFLCDKVKLRDDSRYLHHQGKPVVLLWGLGFRDRRWTPEQAKELVDFFKNDPRYGGVYLIGGVDPYWRTLRGDSGRDPGWAKVYRMFDAISPWDAGRYGNDAGMNTLRKQVWEADLAELKPLGIGYMPTAFPGFSWDNLRRTKPGTTRIDRRKGEFYWRQFAIFRALGIRTVFVGMFDEVNEATAIYKVSGRIPVGTYFVTEEGLPSDWYLKLTGAATRMIRGEAPLSETIPDILPSPKEPEGKAVEKHTDAVSKPRDYHFDKTISREVLEDYLSRSISMEGLLNGRGDLLDNIRMLKSTGAKFIGRSLCLWGNEGNLLRNLERARQQAPKVFEADPEMILQACIFEIVTTQVERIPVPDWAFVGLGQPVEKRNFRYADMLYPDGRRKDQWGRGSSVPDVSRMETKLWFYFLAASFIDLGIEAIHFGQVELMNGNDRDLEHYSQVLNLIRSYAAKHARRHMMLCDAHVPRGGFVRDGRLLLDFHSYPLRIMEVPERPQEAILKVGFSDGLYGRSRGGLTFSGWQCEHLPYLVEIDNWGASRQPGQAKMGGIWVWGYDEITWFAHQSKQYRNDWLHYAWDWVRKTDPNGHLQMPGSRTMRSPKDNRRWYYANTPSAAVPDGLGDEDAIRAIWAADSSG